MGAAAEYLLKRLWILAIQLCRYTLAGLLGGQCRFYPSCSLYAQTAVSQHGIWRGANLTARRIGRCHPWHSGGLDPVPVKTWGKS